MDRFFMTAAEALTERLTETVSETMTEAVTEDLGGFMSSARLELAGQVVLIGLGMIFAVLALLWGILAIFGKVMTRTKKQPAPAESEPPMETAAPAVDEPVAAVATDTEDDGELVAVITAAVVAAIASDEMLSSRFESGFRVVSFKKSARSARGN